MGFWGGDYFCVGGVFKSCAICFQRVRYWTDCACSATEMAKGRSLGVSPSFWYSSIQSCRACWVWGRLGLVLNWGRDWALLAAMRARRRRYCS